MMQLPCPYYSIRQEAVDEAFAALRAFLAVVGA